jgi:hypothetical protein
MEYNANAGYEKNHHSVDELLSYSSPISAQASSSPSSAPPKKAPVSPYEADADGLIKKV